MKCLLKIFSVLFTMVFAATLACSAFAAKPTKVRTAWLDEHEAFLMWYAKEKGWDKQEGLDIEMLLFSSGMAQLNALPAGEWVLAGTGAVPGMMAALRYNAYVVGIGNDESFTNAVLVRPDSPIYKTKGYNKDYPEVYGHPDDVRGKTFLITTMSSPHFTLSHWLRVLGLKESDVIIKNMDQAQALAAFDSGIGDGVSLWAPHMYVGQDKGWKVVGTPNSCKEGLPIVLIADKKYADANPETVAKFLRIYMRAVNMLQKETPEALAPEYRRFFLEWIGKEFTVEMSALDLSTHPVFNIDEQIALFDTSKGQSTAGRWMDQLSIFFAKIGRITPAELKKVEGSTYCTDKFLKMVQQPIPDYK